VLGFFRVTGHTFHRRALLVVRQTLSWLADADKSLR
jgi:hypothetical protein